MCAVHYKTLPLMHLIQYFLTIPLIPEREGHYR